MHRRYDLNRCSMSEVLEKELTLLTTHNRNKTPAARPAVHILCYIFAYTTLQIVVFDLDHCSFCGRFDLLLQPQYIFCPDSSRCPHQKENCNLLLGVRADDKCSL
uniref:RNA-directed RNA polymerase n=1 Tax=Zeugodacus cucurbitae TaxID=28588 RepID=A0A0A1XHS6_ZEUCU